MKKENLVLITNEKIMKSNMNHFCDNIDIKSIPEGLDKNFQVLLITRKSKIERSHEINIKDIHLAGNIICFLINILKTFKKKRMKYLLISITPYTFLAYLLLFICRKEVFVYLRSNGYEEHKYIYPFFGPFIYHIMFTIVSWKANLISCRSHILRGKNGKIVFPSQLTNKWFSSHINPDLKKIKLLYVGRIKVEKGIFSLLDILKGLKTNFFMSVVTTEKKISHNINQQNVDLIEFENKNDSIIEIYDSHNIFILPSFTEGHPQVLDEALSRLRPVIIFEDISHVVGNRQGVFVAKRDSDSLSKIIVHIINNYKSIQEKISKNILPTKEKFLEEISLILNNN